MGGVVICATRLLGRIPLGGLRKGGLSTTVNRLCHVEPALADLSASRSEVLRSSSLDGSRCLARSSTYAVSNGSATVASGGSG